MTYTIDIQQHNGAWYSETAETYNDAYAIVCAVDDAQTVLINDFDVSTQDALEAWQRGEKFKAETEQALQSTIDAMKTEIVSIKDKIMEMARGMVAVIAQFDKADGFTITVRGDTDYCGIPTGHLEEISLVAFIREHGLELDGYEGNALYLRAEWGNGEGHDYFTVTL